MKQEKTKSSTTRHSRCRHFTANGRQCRLRVLDTHSGLCFRHAGLQNNQPADVDLTAMLSVPLGEFKNASQINDFLSKLLVLLAQNRISSRRAAVLAYITNQLLRTLTAIQDELDAQSPQDAPYDLIVDIPRPDRTPRSEPS
jgi:hypothetical protein